MKVTSGEYTFYIEADEKDFGEYSVPTFFVIVDKNGKFLENSNSFSDGMGAEGLLKTAVAHFESTGEYKPIRDFSENRAPLWISNPKAFADIDNIIRGSIH